VDGRDDAVHQVAPRLVDGASFLDEVLAALQRCDGRRLADGRRAGRALADQLADGAYELQRPTGVADAPAGHGVALGEAADEKGPVGESGRHRRHVDVTNTVVREVLV